MSSPRKRTPRRVYIDAEKVSYVDEAIQHGNHKAYCREKNIPYFTFKDWKCEYQASTDKENWSPKSIQNVLH